VEAIERLARLDPKIALLALLAVRGVKPVSKVDSFEGPDEALAKLLRELGLETDVKQSGCQADVVFGTPKGMAGYRRAGELRGKEKVYRLGLAFGYPECCARYFSRFMAGEADEKPGREPPLEHFVCPGCTESPGLKDKYERALKEINRA
jgi:hypothetical protein